MRRSSMTDRSSITNLALAYPWTKTTEDATSFYKVDETNGLTEARAREDLEKYGPNGIFYS